AEVLLGAWVEGERRTGDLAPVERVALDEPQLALAGGDVGDLEPAGRVGPRALAEQRPEDVAGPRGAAGRHHRDPGQRLAGARVEQDPAQLAPRLQVERDPGALARAELELVLDASGVGDRGQRVLSRIEVI